MIEDITFVLTSCGRVNLLFKTIDSFLKYNTYPIKEYIIIEDSGDDEIVKKIRHRYGEQFKIIANQQNIGLIKSIDKVYSTVSSKYVFHCEDDWVFYRSGFIEDSLEIINFNPTITYISLRSYYHDLHVNSPSIAYSSSISISKNLKIREISNQKRNVNIAFSGNPHLFELNNTIKGIMPFSKWATCESDIERRFSELGFKGVILENDAVAHIGWQSSTFNYRRYNFSVRTKNFIKAFMNLLGFQFEYEL